MENQQDLQSFSVVWRGRKLVVEMNLGATLKELGDKLQRLTHVEADTLRLLVPVEKNSKLLYPFSDEHSHLSLESASILKGKSIRMMGVPKDEVDEVLQNAKADLRIAGFDEEEKRLKQRIYGRSYNSTKLPQGNYIFCDFRTLSLPGVVLNPPASKALELLHKLASDPGIVAIMNKHRWRVGILTEMAPVGYVGISPECILGFNKNHGEEISLRLRTDDLKGFRKYEKIKKTLLHELAHMVFSEHDSNFLALDSQLNKEAATLDWTKSRGHTLSGGTLSEQYDEEFDTSSNVISSHKLGGRVSVLPTARAASANAAFARLADTSTLLSESSGVPDLNIHEIQNESKPVPDDSDGDECMQLDPPRHEQSNPTDSGTTSPRPNLNGDFGRRLAILESELDNAEADQNHPREQNAEPPDQRDSTPLPSIELPSHVSGTPGEAHPSDSHVDEMQTEPDSGGMPPRSHSTEPDPDDPELRIIQDPVTVFCGRLQRAVQSLRNETTPSETDRVLQTLIKIVGNVMEHPNDVKFRKLRKANPLIQRNIVTYKAAVEILKLIGFHEEVIVVESGNTEPYFMLKRNDPGLLWLAKSSLSSCIS
ncbi:uncharacterized protein LOC131003968 [Salvia miltiorrhiza]|uniref:uncharacterized protein LOC131003968 n=1 Tax=Salvia miltiorrhiza TaxID=226208 RepID=UPI0025AC574B|nr:uncharacterized protein LOC131003968 [Salvia miltiorrhiza]XP_057786524.1 uncharacterized protein LOC131003968 [Salvia miltiorrhiza]